MAKVVIIGGGISGLSTAVALQQEAEAAGLTLETLVLEKDDVVGGKIKSIKKDGFLCEWGPNGFLDSKPMTLDLCNDIDISDRLLRSNDNARKRFIYADDTLHRLPETPPSFMTSPLISWPGKFRMAMELFIAQRRDGADETLADFARRRLGPEALEKLIGPMVSGIFAGDPETMSLKSCFPRINELEQQYGGLLKAMLALAKKKKNEEKQGKVAASAAGPGGILTSFVGGIQDLTDALSQYLNNQIRTSSEVKSIEKRGELYRLELADGEAIEADIVVSAMPAYALAAAVRGLSAQTASQLDNIPYSPMNVVCFGYEKERIELDLNGFGYLITKPSGRNTLGTLWDSSIFPNRAPEGHVLLRSMMGGATNPQAAELSDDEVMRLVKSDLRHIMGINEDPDFVQIFRHQHAIPQYIPGHQQRIDAMKEALQKTPGFYLNGNAFGGVGINDCVRSSNEVAAAVVDNLKRAS